jgi:mono/diheme cytochrome c family protein
MMSSSIAELSAVLATVLSVTGAFAQTPGTPAPALHNSPESVVKYWLEPAPSPQAGVLERGKWLFRQKGCFLCHGPEGQGGVPNLNYIKDTIPRLALAEQMKLFEPEDVSAILEQMKRGVRLDSLADSPPVPQYNVVLAQYHSIQDVIRKGNPAGKKNPKGPAPPLNMPRWERELSDADIDALIAYLLSAVPAEQPRGMPGTPGG